MAIHDEAMSHALTCTRLVGVDGSESSTVATAIAFSEAFLRRTVLIAVYAFHDRAPRVESGFVLSCDNVEQPETAALTARPAGHRARYPDVPVTAKAVAAGPVPFLQNDYDGAALVVVGGVVVVDSWVAAGVHESRAATLGDEPLHDRACGLGAPGSVPWVHLFCRVRDCAAGD